MENKPMSKSADWYATHYPLTSHQAEILACILADDAMMTEACELLKQGVPFHLVKHAAQVALDIDTMAKVPRLRPVTRLLTQIREQSSADDRDPWQKFLVDMWAAGAGPFVIGCTVGSGVMLAAMWFTTRCVELFK